jgi:hypothetical protein
MTHNEATVILFTDLYRDGHRWSLTVRQGATMEDVDALLTIAQGVQERATSHGFAFREATPQFATADNGGSNGPPPPVKTIAGLEGVTTSAPRQGETGGRILCNRIEFSGSRVKFYAANDALKYPVLNAPDWQLRKALSISDEDSLPDLSGEWIIEWAASEKLNSKGNPYKDLVAIWEREDYEGTTATMTPAPPENGHPKTNGHWSHNPDTVAAMLTKAKEQFDLDQVDVLKALQVEDPRDFEGSKGVAWKMITAFAQSNGEEVPW